MAQVSFCVEGFGHPRTAGGCQSDLPTFCGRRTAIFLGIIEEDDLFRCAAQFRRDAVENGRVGFLNMQVAGEEKRVEIVGQAV